jgi:hypothetical protein
MAEFGQKPTFDDSKTALEARLMHVQQFGAFGVQFGLIKDSGEMVSQAFLD